MSMPTIFYFIFSIAMTSFVVLCIFAYIEIKKKYIASFFVGTNQNKMITAEVNDLNSILENFNNRFVISL